MIKAKNNVIGIIASVRVNFTVTAVSRVGKISAARTLKKKITEIAYATSSSSASITGAVAAIADPPQTERYKLYRNINHHKIVRIQNKF